MDAGTRGDGVAEPVSSGREQGAYNECGCGEVADIRAEKRDGDFQAERGVRAHESGAGGREQEIDRDLRGDTTAGGAAVGWVPEREEGRADDAVQAVFSEAEQGEGGECRGGEAAGGAGGGAGERDGGEGDGGAEQLGGD